MTDQPSLLVPRRKRRWLRAVVAVLVLVPAAICVASLLYYHSTSELLKRRIDAALRVKLETLRAEGLPLTFAELDKWYTTPPPGENAATVLQEAFAVYSKPNPPSRGWRETDEYWSLLPVIGSARLPPGTEPLPKQMKDAIAEVLSQNDAALKLLHKGASMTTCRYPIDSTRGFDVRLPHLNNVRLGAKLLTLEMLLHAEKGESELAVESAQACFGVAHSLVNEPVVLSQLIRFSCQVMGARNLERVLTKATLTDEQLEQLDMILAEAEDPQGLTRAFVGDRCNVLKAYNQVRKAMAAPVRFWPTLEGLRQLTWRDAYYYPADRMEAHRRATSGLFELEVLMSIEFRTACIRASQLPFPEQISLAKQIVSQEMNGSSFLLMPASTGAMVKQATCVALIRAARVALAVERYRLANAHLPDNLTESTLLDPFDGQPLRYKKLTKGYIVYSVGEDKVDNGGTEGYWPGTDITFTVER